ncbi:MAG: isoamylase [Treponema sp.]|jgi:hypothetical protein|nr:isoamylase [Treponema sp.]
MKTITAVSLLLFIIGNIGALDTESYQFIDYLLNIEGPGEPRLFEDGVVFTASSSYRHVGVAFAHEGFSSVHWFSNLMVPDFDAEPQKQGAAYRDSGMLFYVYTVPADMAELEYRLVIDGLWTSDPANPHYRIDSAGLSRSLVAVPVTQKPPPISSDQSGSLSFRFTAESGASISVAGDFNGWDPFMYPLKETAPGVYTLSLPLPPGTYHYVFFYQGVRTIDPVNQNRVYTKDGKFASVALVH